jgi:hypothetical protein
MSLRVRRLRIEAVTGDGPYGLDLELSDGLTLMRADNSMGKSTIIDALIYVLGAEGMLSPTWDMPLKYCMYDHLLDDAGRKHDVLESSVTVELENAAGQLLSARRHVKSDRFQRDLVELWDGRVLSRPDAAKRRGDAFLRTGGSAQREAGFHTQLADFIGWSLPTVTRVDGKRSPLYMQLLFPFLLVEQMHGWSGVRANVPRFLQIRDGGRRAVEFLLSLDANARVQRREELRAEEARIKQKWLAQVAELRGSLAGEPLRVLELPDGPLAAWPPTPPPAIEALHDERWLSLDESTVSLRTRLKELNDREIPTVKAVAAATEGRLVDLEREHRQLAAAHAALVRELEADAADMQRIDERLRSLRTDRQRHVDAERVIDLGGTPATDLSEGRCPTCDQDWPTDLLGGRRPDGEPVMAIAEHLQLIGQEQRSLQSLRKGTEATLQDQRARESAQRQRLAELRADIRAHRETLLGDAKRPSVAAVREQLLLQDRLTRLESVRLTLVGVEEDLERLSVEYRDVRAALAELSDKDLSERDLQRLSRFRAAFLEQLSEYGFRSLDGVGLSEETYLPERKRFDLTHEVSASDTIRLIWAYLLGLMEASEAEAASHPGLLVLDEPGQQDMEDASLAAFLARAARSVEMGCQVLVTITRPLSRLAESNWSVAQVIDIGEREHVLQPLL